MPTKNAAEQVDTADLPTNVPAEPEHSLLDEVRESIADTADMEPDDAPAPKAAPEPEGVQPAEAPAAATAEPEPKAEPNADDEKQIADLGAKGKTAERLREVFARERVKDERIAELEQGQQALVQWQDTIRQTNATPEDLGGALEILHFANQGTPDGATRALAMIDEFRGKLAQRFGLEVAGVDPLAAFPDLQEQVEEGLDRKVALELAKHRASQKVTAERTQQEAETSAWNDRVKAGGDAVDAFCAAQRAKDPSFDAKFAIVKPLIAGIAQNQAPENWLASFQAILAGVQLPQADSRGTRAPAPITRDSAGGGGERQPGSVLEALRADFGL